MPRNNISLLDAISECERKEKILCPRGDWELACRGEIYHTTQFSYGQAYKADACNTEGKGVVNSGSKTACKNAIGVYDMSGNLAEWTLDDALNTLDNLGLIEGGSFKSGAASTCILDSEQRKKNEGHKDVGFRCCSKKLE